jgi:hypothetical protein
MLAVGTLSMLAEHLYSLIDPLSGRSGTLLDHHVVAFVSRSDSGDLKRML